MTNTQIAEQTFTYGLAKVDDIRVESRVSNTGRRVVDRVSINDEQFTDSDRFWNSLFSRFHINQSFFKYYDHAEVFDRIAEVDGGCGLRYCVERTKMKDGKTHNRLLAVTNPNNLLVPHSELVGVLGNYSDEITYHDGVVQSVHQPTRGNQNLSILGDKFVNRFVLDTPIDGYGQPSIYLGFLRMICANGLVAMSKAFRSQISLGNGGGRGRAADFGYNMLRVLDQFNNEEGYAALKQRIESAGSSPASVYESNKLYKILIGMHLMEDEFGKSVLNNSESAHFSKVSPYMGELLKRADKSEREPSYLLKAFKTMTGDINRMYGLANIDALSTKRQRTLPTKASIYDMINFATEVATHHAKPIAAKRLQGWVGSVISEEYDMEGTKDALGDFADLHIDEEDDFEVVRPSIN